MSEGLNIYQRLHAVMGEIDYIQKEKKQGMRYSIVSHDRVTAAVRPLLHKHGIIYNIPRLEHSQDGNRTCVKIQVAFINIDNPDDYFLSESFGYGVDDQDKGPGKAMSYAVKYALLKTLSLETGDEPAENDVPDDEVDEVQDARAKYKPSEDIPLGMVRGEGASRHASNPLFGFLKGEMEKEKNLPDLNLWWVKNAPAVKRMNSEHQQAMFVELMKYGFHIASTIEDLKDFQTSHKTELKKLEDRSKKELEGLRDFYSYAQARINKGSRPAVMDDENVQA